jgi:hypothetical protein
MNNILLLEDLLALLGHVQGHPNQESTMSSADACVMCFSTWHLVKMAWASSK